MSHIVVTGIVTRYVNYKDNDRILTIFTREQGRIDARARGCRRPKSPLLACSQPFVYGEFQLYTGKSNASIDQCDVRETFYPLREDIKKLASASTMLSLIQQIIQENEPNESLFSLLYHGLSFLSYGDTDAIDISLFFILRYLQAIGLSPSVTECAVCGEKLFSAKALNFSPSAGGMVCVDCGHGSREISPLSAEAMRRMLLMDDADMAKAKLPESVRKQLFRALEAYCEYHLERENKAFAAMREFV